VRETRSERGVWSYQARFPDGAGVEWSRRLGNKFIGIFKNNGQDMVSGLRGPIVNAYSHVLSWGVVSPERRAPGLRGTDRPGQ
jgi:hypothetical protein